MCGLGASLLSRPIPAPPLLTQTLVPDVTYYPRERSQALQVRRAPDLSRGSP